MLISPMQKLSRCGVRFGVLLQELDEACARKTVFLYFHTKTMVNHGRHTTRPEAEAQMFRGTIVPWRDAITVFQRNATVTRIGMFPADGGWMWVNFWWARGSYLQTVPEPIRTTRRHYYEDWLARVYDPSTENSTEPGRMRGCGTCYALNGRCSGYGKTYSPETLQVCEGAAEWQASKAT